MKKTNKGSGNSSVRAVPEGFETVTPYLVADQAEKLIEFIKEAFDGEVTFLMKGEKDKIMHATIKVGTSTIMISDKMDNMEAKPAMLYLYVEDVDLVFKQAIRAKGISVREPLTEFYGDRSGAVSDAWDNVWWIATHVEDLDQEELEKRSAKFYDEKRKHPELAER